MARAKRAGRPRAASRFRVGYGADLHPLRAGDRLVLGGIEIGHVRGLAGHSDADVLVHAVCDAILGALGLPDMGTRFPDSEAAHRGRSSLEFLREVAAEAHARGYAIVNLDTVLLAEAPRLRPYLERMRAALATAIDCPVELISIKPKHCEGVGAIGREEGMMAQAAVLLGPPETQPPRRQTGRRRPVRRP